MRGLIDWELLAELQSSPAMSQPAMWDAFATRYDGYTRMQEYHTQSQIDLMNLQAHESVLDVGAGPGRISIPAAQRAHVVTALDTSRRMLDMLERNASRAGVSNVHALHLGWEEVVPNQNVQQHDVVVASRSPAMRDLHKLTALARRTVYVMLFCSGSLKQFHDRLVEGIESMPTGGPARSAIAGHALVFNRAVAMGYEAHVTYLEDGFRKQYRNVNEAVKDFSWLNLPAGSEAIFHRNLRPFLKENEAGVELLVRLRTAAVWWHKHRPASDLN